VTPLQFDPGVFDVPASVWRPVARFLGLVLLAAVTSAAAALVYRWYTRERIRAWLTAVFAGSAVALYLNAVGLFQQALGSDSTAVFDPGVVFFNATTIVSALLVSPVGRAAGDRIATDVFAVAGIRELDAEVSRVVRSVGRVTAVELPESVDDIEDIDGYDPVSAERKGAMAGKTLLFPRRLRSEELTDRLATRLKEDYGVGHVDVELDDEGTVTFLAVGRRVAGLGPTLGPGSTAVAVHADPGDGASAGDVVQVWRLSEQGDAERVVTGELRATAGDVTTLVVDGDDAASLDPHASYRLVTLPTQPSAEREFASSLRSAEETMDAVTVAAESDLAGRTVGDVDAHVAAVRSTGGSVDAIPPRSRPLEAGDELFVVARPETIRRVARAAAAPADRPADDD
jgi:hypothetical protein